MSMIGLAARPGTAVEPTWSTRSASGSSAARIRAASAANRGGPRGIGVDHSHCRVGLIATGLDLAWLRRMVVHGAPRAWRCGAVRSWRWPGARLAARERLAGTLSRPLGGMPRRRQALGQDMVVP